MGLFHLKILIRMTIAIQNDGEAFFFKEGSTEKTALLMGTNGFSSRHVFTTAKIDFPLKRIFFSGRKR